MVASSALNLVTIIAALWWFKLPDFVGITSEHWNQEYDYIIVGGGAAGAVLANRLSEDPNVKVLVLEAGDVENIYSDIPAFSGSLQLGPMDWQFLTTPQKHSCLGRINRQCRWAHGRVLGGSSTINAMVYIRGNQRDYDRWEENGAHGWSYNQVLPYFIKSENNQNPKLVASGFHGVGGPMPIEDAQFVSPLAPAFIKAAKYLGYDEVDFNGPTQTGVAIPQAHKLNGVRWSTARAFLAPIKKRKNLQVVTNAFVTNILFDKSKRATAVKFDRKKATHIVSARKEIIVTAGGVNSAKLLLLSGIGPKEDLHQFGIPVVADLPVGRNLQDHVWVDGLNFYINKNISLKPETTETTQNAGLYFQHGIGPFAHINPVDAIGFLNTKLNKDKEWPDTEIFLFPFTPATERGAFALRTGISDEVMRQVYWPYNNTDGFTLITSLCRPKSRGYITLRSAHPYDPPVIDPQYFTHPDDIRRMVEAMKLAIALASTPPFQAMGARLYKTVFPGCEKYHLWSEEYMECVARTASSTLYHFVGTTKMGSPHDPTSVVDPQLRVLGGVKGLRLAGEPIIPTITSGNTVAPVMMTAEKAADLIKQTHN